MYAKVVGIPLLLTLGVTWAQTAAVRPKFEVATIRLNKNGTSKPNVRMTPNRVSVVNVSLRLLISNAYKIRDFQISGAPSWVASEAFDIEAKTPEGTNGGDPILLMLQSLLEERFNLRMHYETREGPVYFLKIAKSGSIMRTASCIPFDPNDFHKEITASDEERKRLCGGINSRQEGRIRTLDGNGMTMEDMSGPAFQSLAGKLSQALDRPVINKTGLDGLYEVHLRWAADEEAPLPGQAGDPNNAGPRADATAAPSIFTALEEQLGLKLESGKGPMQYLVVDHINQPSEN